MSSKKPAKPEAARAAPVDKGGRLLRLGLATDAAREFEQVLQKSPRDIEALRGLVRAHLTRGVNASARAALERLLAVAPEDLEARSHLALLDARRGDPDALKRLWELASDPGAGFYQHFNLAGALVDAGVLDHAENSYRAAASFAPTSPYAWFELGRLALNRGDHPVAVAELTRAVQLAPADWVPRLLLSRAQAARGELGAAVKTLNEALVLNPREAALYEDLFKLCMASGSTQGALKAAIELRQLGPGNANYVYLHGLAILAAGQVAQAKELFELALRQAPESWEAKQALAQTLSMLADAVGAERLLEEIVGARPAEPGPANDLALLYLARADTAPRVRALLAPVLAAHPEEPAAHLNLALALAGSDRAEALVHARKVLELPAPELHEQARALVSRLG